MSSSSSFDSSKWETWRNENEWKAKKKFYFTLTGDADSTTDITIPISSFQARVKTDNPTYLSVVIPDLDNQAAAVNARSNGDLIIEMAYEIAGRDVLRWELIRVDLEEIRTDEGPRSQSITLSGHKTHSFSAKNITLEYANYKSVQEGWLRFRTPIDLLIKPGDTVTIDSETFVAGEISINANAHRQIMEIAESTSSSSSLSSSSSSLSSSSLSSSSLSSSSLSSESSSSLSSSSLSSSSESSSSLSSSSLSSSSSSPSSSSSSLSSSSLSSSSSSPSSSSSSLSSSSLSSSSSSEPVTTWNPSDKSASITLSNGDLTAATTATTDWESVRATDGISSGKYYWEIRCDDDAYQAQCAGVGNSSASLVNICGSDANGWGYYGSSGNKVHDGSYTPFGSGWDSYSNDIVGVALDMTAGKIWFAKNNVWQDSGDPANGTGEAFSGLSGTLFPMYSHYSSGDICTARFDSGDWTYTPPAGFGEI